MNILATVPKETFIIIIAILVSISIICSIYITLLNRRVQKTCKRVIADLEDITQKRDDMQRMTDEAQQRIREK